MMAMQENLQIRAHEIIRIMKTKKDGKIKPPELKGRLGCSMRMTRYTLKMMTKADWIEKHIDLNDLRSFWYQLPEIPPMPDEKLPENIKEENLLNII